MIHTAKELQRKLLRWYRDHRRDLPWRVSMDSHAKALPDAYFVLVSEAMLQQTQVATVIPYFNRFIKAFPTIQDLADADEQHVLLLWQGLGYYSRARNLRGAARMVVEEFGGKIPSNVEALRRLPGVGRYTAGAIASLAFGRREPIVDGNITRVICRLDCIEGDPRDRAMIERIWDRARELLPEQHVADFNSALMELGATVCTPKQPKCLLCPLREHCAGLAAGKVERIPPAKKAKPTPINRRIVLCLMRSRGGRCEVLIEQRPPGGRWAGMWQFVTVEPEGKTAVKANPPTAAMKQIERQTGAVAELRLVAQLKHQLTHRRYEFDVYAGRLKSRGKPAESLADNRRWVSMENLSDFPLPRPHELVRRMLAEQLAHLPPLA